MVYISKTWLWLLNGDPGQRGSRGERGILHRSGRERAARMRVGAEICFGTEPEVERLRFADGSDVERRGLFRVWPELMGG